MLSYFFTQWNLQVMIGSLFVLPLVVLNEKSGTAASNGKNMKSKPKYSYPSPVLLDDLHEKYVYHKKVRGRDYYWKVHPIFAFGVEKFVSYAAHFCRYENQNGSLEVVSVGSGNGTIENDIVAAYEEHFGGRLNITLVDPADECAGRVHFKRVNDLIEKRPHVVRNCVLLIICPEGDGMIDHDHYDLGAICELQPRAALIVYEMNGLSGGEDLREFLKSRYLHARYTYEPRYPCNDVHRLNNYTVRKVQFVEVNLNDPEETTCGGPKADLYLWFGMMKLERTD